MVGDDAVIGDEKIESLTLRNLRELRRDQQMLFDLVKRQNERLGRMSSDMDRNTNELKSDIVLLENRSLTAMENDTYLRRKVDDLSEDMATLLTGLANIQKQISNLTDAVEKL